MKRRAFHLVTAALVSLSFTATISWFSSAGLRATIYDAAAFSGLPWLQRWGFDGVVAEARHPYDFVLFAMADRDAVLSERAQAWWQGHFYSGDFDPRAFMAALARGLRSRKVELRRSSAFFALYIFESNQIHTEELTNALLSAAEDEDRAVRLGVIRGLVGGDIRRFDELSTGIARAAGDDEDLEARGQMVLYALRERRAKAGRGP